MGGGGGWWWWGGVNIISFTCGHTFPTTTSRQVHVPASDSCQRHTHTLYCLPPSLVSIYSERASPGDAAAAATDDDDYMGWGLGGG